MGMGAQASQRGPPSPAPERPTATFLPVSARWLCVTLSCASGRLLSRTVSTLMTHDFVTLYSSTLRTVHKYTLNTEFWGWSPSSRGTRGHASNPSWAGSSFKCSAWPEMQYILSDNSQSQANSVLCSSFLIFGAFQRRPETYANPSDHFSIGASEVLETPHWPHIPQDVRFPAPEVCPRPVHALFPSHN